MAFNIEPGKRYRIVRLEIAVPFETDVAGIADEMNNRLAIPTEIGLPGELGDWRYMEDCEWVAIAPKECGEGDIFTAGREWIITDDPKMRLTPIIECPF